MTERIAAQTLAPTISSWREIPFGVVPGGTVTAANVSTQDAKVPGGGLLANNGAAVTYFGTSVVQLPTTTAWWITFKGPLKGSGASSHDSECGIINAAGSHLWKIGRVNAVSSTKYCLGIVGTSSPTPTAGVLTADNNVHIFRMFFDGTDLWSYIDGTLDAEITSVAPMANEPFFPFLYSATVLEAGAIECLVGYVG